MNLLTNSIVNKINICWLLLLCIYNTRAEDIRVTVKNGTLEGFRVDLNRNSASGPVRKADIFLGIPYAKPPVGNLRLRKPQPALNWTGVRDAKTLRAPCIPAHFLTAFGYSENCLFLNIFRPVEPTTNKTNVKYPVLVFIHGGGFNVGGNFVERYENISDNFVSQKIVVVTLQYRLGFFGYFSDGTAEFPGNYGLWDQRQALLWIQENIGAFGGDPRRVTLWGQSAGAASVSMHSLSRHSRLLFQQVIQQSGSALSPWALNEDVVKFSRNLAAEMGCPLDEASEEVPIKSNTTIPVEDDEDSEFPKNQEIDTKSPLRACLQEINHEDVLFSLSTKELIRGEFGMVVFNPRWDGEFFDVDFVKAIHRGPKKPSLIGYNTHEAAFLTLDYGGSVFGFRGPMTVDQPDEYDFNDLVKFIDEKIRLVNNSTVSSSQELKLKSLRHRITQLYMTKNETGDNRDFHYYMEQYTLLLSDILFIMPVVWEARMKAQNSWPVYLFHFDYSNAKMFTNKPFKAVTHGAEYPYTLGVHIFGNFDFNEEDNRIRRILVSTMTSFVKQSNPSTEEVFWPTAIKASKDEKHARESLKVLRIRGAQPRVDADPKGVDQRLQAWDRLSKKFNLSRFYGLPTFLKSI